MNVQRNTRLSMILAAAGKIGLIISSIIFLLSATGCDLEKRHPLAGEWSRYISPSTVITIKFGEDGSFRYFHKDQELPYDGSYSYEEDIVTVVDKYCGTALPGKYRFESGKKEITFALVDDQWCTRKRYFVGTWHKELADTTTVSPKGSLPLQEEAMPDLLKDRNSDKADTITESIVIGGSQKTEL
ncbi:MAG: hypothetical protein GF398_11280 [Chitinivibrionales bacterium]|nr:hypothetical protein [Chitinivibrionales bacterium]